MRESSIYYFCITASDDFSCSKLEMIFQPSVLANDVEFLLEVNGMCSVVNTNNYTYLPNSISILDYENRRKEEFKEMSILELKWMYFFIGYNSIRMIFIQNIFKKIPDAVLFILQNFYQESFLHEFHIHCFHKRMHGKNKEYGSAQFSKYVCREWILERLVMVLFIILFSVT